MAVDQFVDRWDGTTMDVWNPPGQWGYSRDRGPESGVNTGFSVFSGPGQGNVPDARRAFASFYNEEDQHPAFSASTESMRRSLNGLARKAEHDPQAAITYDRFSGMLDARRRLYDIGYAEGLNDMNANDAWQMAWASSDPSDTAADWGLDRHVKYLAREALQRGQNVRDLASAQSMMDNSFTGGLHSSLGAAKGSSAPAWFSQLSGNKSAMKEISLRAKSALQEWEQAHGLRSDDMRGLIMRQAGAYYAQALAIGGLNRFTGDMSAVIDAAARKVGAVGGPQGPNVFERYNNAVGSLENGFITYYGSPDRDSAAGMFAPAGPKGGGVRTKAHGVIESCFREMISRNVSADRDAWDLDESGNPDNVAQLRQDLIGGLAAISPAAARMDGAQGMLEDAADRIIGMARTGSVDLSRLATMYINDSSFVPIDAAGPQATYGLDKALLVADKLVADNLADRSVMYRGWDLQAHPEFTRAGVESSIDSELNDMTRSDPSLALMAKENPELWTDLRSTLSDYILTTNNVTDPHALGSTNVEDARKALRDRVAVLFMANDIRKLCGGKLDWKPVSTVDDRSPDVRPTFGGVLSFLDPNSYRGLDSSLRGNSPEAVRSLYGGLKDKIDAHLQDRWGSHPDTDRMSDQDYVTFHALRSASEGLGKMTSSGYDPGWYTSSRDEVAMKRADESRRAAEHALGYSNGAFNVLSSPGLRDAVSARQSMRNAQVGRLKAGVDPRSSAALQMLMGQVFSDTQNPVLAGKADLYTKKRISEVAPYLSDEQKAGWADRAKWATLKAMSSLTADHALTPQDMLNDDALYSRLDQIMMPVFGRAANESAARYQLQQQALLQKTQSVAEVKRKVASGD